MMKRHASRVHAASWWSIALALGMAVGMVQSAHAQKPLTVTDLDGRVSPALASRVRVLADSAVAARLPVSPLVDKTLEGASKHASDDRIAAAVHSVLAGLRTARTALGAGASDQELVAGMVVLRAGVTPNALADARRRLPHRSLAVPLSVLGSLVAAGIPAAQAEDAVVAEASRSDDASMLAFGRSVERSIASGVSASSALSGTNAQSAPTSLHDPSAGAHPKPKP